MSIQWICAKTKFLTGVPEHLLVEPSFTDKWKSPMWWHHHPRVWPITASNGILERIFLSQRLLSSSVGCSFLLFLQAGKSLGFWKTSGCLLDALPFENGAPSMQCISPCKHTAGTAAAIAYSSFTTPPSMTPTQHAAILRRLNAPSPSHRVPLK